jgi:hypothetical protein
LVKVKGAAEAVGGGEEQGSCGRSRPGGWQGHLLSHYKSVGGGEEQGNCMRRWRRGTGQDGCLRFRYTWEKLGFSGL